MVASPPNDTSAAAERVQLDLLRRAGFERRAALTGALSASVVRLSRRALRERMPDATPNEVLIRWVALHYGEELSRRLAEDLAARAP